MSFIDETQETGVGRAGDIIGTWRCESCSYTRKQRQLFIVDPDSWYDV